MFRTAFAQSVRETGERRSRVRAPLSLRRIQPEIYALGIRSALDSLFIQTVSWDHENGPQGGDEIDIIRPGSQLRLASHLVWPCIYG